MDLLPMLAAAAGNAGEETDEDFANTVLLLHGDGTNGAQNNTFLDSSTNNFTITRNGNTTQGTFSPFSKPDGRWGNYFSGSGDYLSVTDNGDLDLGTGNFCVEFFWYPQSTGSQQYPLIGTSTGDWYVIWESGNISFGRRAQGNDVSTTGFTLAQNTWQHFCVTRQGTGTNETRIFVNGVLRGVGTSTQNYAITTTLTIGAAAQPLTGYLSNVRVIKGSVPSEYQTASTTTGTSIFTPPTSALTAVSGTELLTCQSNRFVDNSVNAFTTAPTGNVKVTPFSPFPITTAYDPAVNGGAGYFDGSGDYLQRVSPSSALTDWTSTNFTLEYWIYPSAFGSNANGNSNVIGNANDAGANEYWSFGPRSNGTVRWYYFTGSLNNVTTTTELKLNEWSHIAFVNNSNNLTIYINGVSSATATISGTPQFGSSVAFTIGKICGSSFSGYLSNIRMVKSAVYTTGFTPPTAPLTSITNTSLLCNFTNAGIFDNTCFNALETVGNAQINTTTKKYGTGSIEFDGTGDWLKVPNSSDIQLGTGDFTIEFWVYLATGDTGSNRGLVAKGGASTGWLVSLNTTEKVVFTYTTSTITSSGAITLDAWNHIAVVREGTGSNETKIYIGGTNDGTGTVNTNFNQTEVMYVGANRVAGDPMKGFIDDLRITKGIARYTSTFTPPTKALPDIGE